MSWFAILLALASLGGAAPPGKVAKQRCGKAATCKRAAAHAPARPVATPPPSAGAAPVATPTPTVAPAPTGTPAATPTPVRRPSRTGVDLGEWVVRPSYATLASGRIVFNAANLGEDDHNLSLRGDGHEYGRVTVAPGEAAALVVSLAPGVYTLYCSLAGHEEQGMRADITVQ